MKLSAQKNSLSVALAGTVKFVLIAALFLGAVSAAVPAYAKISDADAAVMVADYATGKKHLSVIVKEAGANGISMKEVFAALMKASLSVDSIVYAAITDGISPEAVIVAAIQSGGNVAKVVDAANSAGVSSAVIKSAAVSAGASVETVAGALASTTSSSAQIGAGYSAPEAVRSTFTPPSMSSPTTGGGGGGGGGGLPASPTVPVSKAGYK